MFYVCSFKLWASAIGTHTGFTSPLNQTVANGHVALVLQSLTVINLEDDYITDFSEV